MFVLVSLLVTGLVAVGAFADRPAVADVAVVFGGGVAACAGARLDIAVALLAVPSVVEPSSAAAAAAADTIFAVAGFPASVKA